MYCAGYPGMSPDNYMSWGSHRHSREFRGSPGPHSNFAVEEKFGNNYTNYYQLIINRIHFCMNIDLRSKTLCPSGL